MIKKNKIKDLEKHLLKLFILISSVCVGGGLKQMIV